MKVSTTLMHILIMDFTLGDGKRQISYQTCYFSAKIIRTIFFLNVLMDI